MKPPLSYVPLLPVLIVLVAGIVVARGVGADSWIIAIAILCATVALLLKGYRITAIYSVAFAMGIVTLIVDAYSYRTIAPDSGEHQFSAIVKNIAVSDTRQRAIVSLTGRYRGECLITMDGYEPELRMGDNIDFVAEIFQARSRIDVPGDIDLSSYYYNNHIERVATVVHDSISVTGHQRGLKWSIRRYCDKLVDAVVRTDMSDRSQAFIAALLLGEGSLMGDETRSHFSAAGIAHILALSGMHVAAIAGILLILLKPATWFGHKRVRWVSVMMLLWIYALLTGLSPSVVRAVIMFTVVLMAKCLGRFHSTANSLFFAAIVMLAFEPRLLFTASFQMSFMAVLSMIVLPGLLPQITTRRRFARSVVNFLAYTMSAVLGTLPLVIYYFHEFPLYFLLANIPCAILLPPILIVAIITVTLHVFYIDCSLLDRALDIMCGIVTDMAVLFGELPYATISCIDLSPPQVIVAYSMMGILFFVLYKRNKAGVLATLAGILILAILCIPDSRSNDVLFVGRSNDATAVVYTDGTHGYVLSTAPIARNNSEGRRVGERYERFFAQMQVDTLSLFSTDVNRIINFGDYKLALVNNDTVKDSIVERFHYLIVGGGFKGDIGKLISKFNCDTLLLGSDINRRRRLRYFRESMEAGIPVRDLSDSYGLILTTGR